MKIPSRQRCGMTAIEVLVATMLASLMLASVAGLLGALSRQDRELRAREEVPQWHEQLTEQFLLDLRNSRRFHASRDGVWLEGFMARDFVTARATGQPAMVEYYLVEASGERWLVRREEHTNEHTNISARVEIVCRGVQQIKFGEMLVDHIAAAATGLRPPTADQLMRSPDRIPVRLYAVAAAEPFLDKVLCVR